MKRLSGRTRSQHGGILMAAMAYILVTSLIIAGILTLSASHFARVQTESSYNCALPIAEAGINYELNNLSVNGAASQDTLGNAKLGLVGMTGTYSVYCAQDAQGTVAWNGTSLPFYILSQGTINGVSRTVSVGATKYGGAGPDSVGPYALFGYAGGTLNGTVTITGDVGTNGGTYSGSASNPLSNPYGQGLSSNGTPTITGSVVFNDWAGPGDNWHNLSGISPAIRDSAAPIAVNTVSAVALQLFPANQYANGGGLAYLATNNDNTLATGSVSISYSSGHSGNGNYATITLNNGQTFTFHGKAGGANYYLNTLTCNGTGYVIFDNTAGPITIWVGPSGSLGAVTLNGGTATIKMTQDATKPVKVFVATTSDVTLTGSSEVDAGIYNMNGAGQTGNFTLNGTPTIDGSVIAYNFIYNQTPIVNYVPGYFNSSGSVYYAAVSKWQEINSAY